MNPLMGFYKSQCIKVLISIIALFILCELLIYHIVLIQVGICNFFCFQIHEWIQFLNLRTYFLSVIGLN